MYHFTELKTFIKNIFTLHKLTKHNRPFFYWVPKSTFLDTFFNEIKFFELQISKQSQFLTTA